MATTEPRPPLEQLEELTRRRHLLQLELELLEHARHRAILAAIDDGASVTTVATLLGITRQALTRYLARRTTDHAS